MGDKHRSSWPLKEEGLSFGIQELDRMLDLERDTGARRSASGNATSIAIVGPDGTGKSVLALHLASRYFADHYWDEEGHRKQSPSRVIYVSTDLGYKSADTMWSNFGLDVPYQRESPMERARRRYARTSRHPKENASVHLKSYLPGKESRSVAEGSSKESRSVVEYLSTEASSDVCFLDLAFASAGDDWEFVTRLVAHISGTGKNGGDRLRTSPHLLIIDSIAGLETLVGDTDGFGERTSRRARIAQVMRAVRNECTIVFVVEEPKPGEVLPEEYVADTVIRLRRFTETDSSWRTIEIEKARARTHAVGQHAFEILDRKGSSTGRWQNPDEPACKNSYVQIYYSIHHRDRQIRQRRTPGTPPLVGNQAKFRIDYLDDMLPDKAGLPWGSLSALVGDAGTGKSILAGFFLCEGAREYVERLQRLTQELESPNECIELLSCWARIRGWWPAVTSEDPADPTKEWDYKLDDVQRQKLSDKDKNSISALAQARNLPRLREAILGIDKPAREKVMEHFGTRGLEGFPELFSNRAKTRRLPRDHPQRRTPQDPPSTRRQYPWAWMKEVPSGSMAMADWILRHPAFAQPMVLITTSDVNSDDLAQKFTNWLLPKKRAKKLERCVERYITRHLICRRLNMQGTPASRLYHVIERCWVEAQWMIFGPIIAPSPDQRCSRCWRIRLVIDDFRALHDMYPDLRNDPLFLPFLRHSVGAEGITTLIVCTDPGRPDKDPRDEWIRELRSLAANQILTWPVPFFGGSRSAITVEPGEGLIRQLELRESQRPNVDPQFELYEGLEQGIPKLVPLEVRLYSETPGFEQYVLEENRLFREAFAGGRLTPSGSDVIVSLKSADYEGLRDACPLPVETRRDHSLVFQVDGFWAIQGRGSLASQHDYLNQKLEPATDPFRLFWETAGSPGEKAKEKKRLDFFDNLYYNTRIKPAFKDKRDRSELHADRVPFMWDFGLLLLKHDYWREASGAPLPLLVKHCRALWGELPERPDHDLERFLESKLTVGHVFGALPNVFQGEDSETCQVLSKNEFLTDWKKMPASKDDVKITIPLNTWRAFLEAARVVGERTESRIGRPVPKYEIASISPESISCQVLEMWLSEIYAASSTNEREELLKNVSARQFDMPKDFGLVHLLDPSRKSSRRLDAVESGWAWNRNSLMLYKVWLLLLEVLDFSSFSSGGSPFEFPLDREAAAAAVACRHWYKSACTATNKGELTGHASELYIPVRLPGHFSTRGDWYLAAAQGNRSERLAHRAIDLLSSRRANLRRLQLGLGLPTRDVLPDSQMGGLRTALRCPDANAITQNVTYAQLNRIAAPLESDPEKKDPDFFWLWRSSFKDYDRQSRAWQRWINRLFLWSHEYRHQPHRTWKGGFEPYDEIQRDDFQWVQTFESYKEHFPKHLALLTAELLSSSRAPNYRA